MEEEMKKYSRNTRKKTKTDFESELKELREKRKRMYIEIRENELSILKFELAIETLKN